ncbi:MAG: GPP34 family phosphoprotein, partial [Candidatus Krumholzibacteria bacterium]|nr:GPP34 family phosphoprotein [Candidatus Krumholzibacteria bacterium]
MADPLYLQEEIMLLTLRDKEGTIASGTNYQYAIGGAVLAELLLRNRVTVDEEKRKKRFLRLVDSTPLGDPVIDECIQKVKTAKRRAQLQAWVSRFAGVKNAKHRVAEKLCRRGILRADEDKVLMIFSRKIYPEIDPEPEREIIDRLSDAIFTDT